VLIFVPTPIGNLTDISFRALEALKNAQIILCEDTRVTKKLLNLINQKLNFRINLDKQYFSVHSHNEERYTTNEFMEIYNNNNVVYVSDAGMPCVSDPGAILVNMCIKNNIKYDVIPGANALLTAYAMSGFNKKEFLFNGFLPHKEKNRKEPLLDMMNSNYINILYESTHRIKQLLNEINSIDSTKEIFIVKELTKLHQTFYKDTIKNIIKKFNEIDLRGEWVIVIDANTSFQGKAILSEDIIALKLPPKQKAKLISKLSGKNIKDIYNSLVN
jgi:16S rRNA (cytidine1402-2'-O)-methyltransferase